MSTVSVVIACDSRARSIPGCLDSVLSQDGVTVEVLLVDEGTNDWTAAVVAAAARSDARVRAVTAGEGGAKARPTMADALAAASGEYTVLLNVDDRLSPGALARAVGVLGSHPQVGMVYGDSLPFYSDDAVPRASTEVAVPELWHGRDWIAERCRTASMGIASARVVVRTGLERQLGHTSDAPSSSALPWSSALPPHAALARGLRLAARADVAFLRGVEQTYVVAGVNAVARQGRGSPVEDLRLRKASFDALFAVDGRALPEARDLHAMVNLALAREALSVAGSGGRELGAGWVAELEVFARQAYAEAGGVHRQSGASSRRTAPARWRERGRRRRA